MSAPIVGTYWWKKQRQAWTARIETGDVYCGRCHRIILPTEPWQLDHQVAHALGGSDDPTNLAPAHRTCNARHGAYVRIDRDRAQHAALVTALDAARAQGFQVPPGLLPIPGRATIEIEPSMIW